MKDKYDAIVVGLGPVGSFMSLLLEKQGLSVLAFDKEEDIYQLPRAVSMSDQGLRMHQSLGLEDIYFRNSDRPDGAGFVDENLEYIGEPLMTKDLITPNGWAPLNMFHQPYTDKEIRGKLKNSSCDTMVLQELISAKDDGNEIVCSVKNIETNEENTYRTDYLIGADGANSKVREIKKITQEDLNYNRNWIIIDVEIIDDVNLNNVAIQICDPKRIGTYIPTHAPFKRWEFEIFEDDNIEEISSDENINKLLTPWLKPNQYKILRKAIYQFNSVLANEFQKDNYFLVGDAAHQNPPFMGEGMMTGCRDAMNLSWKIGMIHNYDLNDALLKSYQIERKPHAKFIVENSLGIGQLMEAYAHTPNKEDVPLELVAKGYGSFVIPPLDEGIFYLGKSNPDSMTGDLFPQPVLYSEGLVQERCDYLLGDNFAIVSRSSIDLNAEEKEFLDSIGTKIVNLDKKMIESNIWMSSMIEENKIYLVRPDKYVFGLTDKDISLSDLIDDLKNRIGFNLNKEKKNEF